MPLIAIEHAPFASIRFWIALRATNVGAECFAAHR